MKQTAHHQRATPIGHMYPTKRKWTSPRNSTWTFPPREPGLQPGRACQHGSRVKSVPGHPLHSPRYCLLQKYTSAGQSEHPCHSIPARKILLQEKMHTVHLNNFSLMSAHPLCVKSFFLPKKKMFSEINVFSPEKWCSVCALLGERKWVRVHSSQAPALTSI